MKAFLGRDSHPEESAMIHLSPKDKIARAAAREAQEAREQAAPPRLEQPVRSEPGLSASERLFAERKRQEEIIRGIVNAQTTAEFLKSLVLINFDTLPQETAWALNFKMDRLPDRGKEGHIMSREEMLAMQKLDEVAG